ncbi:MAG: tRNA threonylcarbamoyladenosine dehydratase [Firmicutes bacterium HGW-Firmicutes-10]|jgi:tRNA A37 threonylcarbamoyladenosine dehydratase|nr:MAG: tRNA threonylcarbamoyladenosine dehydratase [Firmicutes bacterium HGW-Firmicutes-10]
MDESLARIRLLIGDDNTIKISQKCVMVVGLGGVGAIAAESLARFGIGKLILIDHDVVVKSNLNRQMHASLDTVGMKKLDALVRRIHSIKPDCECVKIERFVSMETLPECFVCDVDYVIDAIDTVGSKCDLIEYCQKNNIRIISSLGMGNRMDPTQVRIVKLKDTFEDPLAKVVRYQIRKRGLSDKIDVAFSLEKPIKQTVELNESEIRKDRMPPASSPFVPNAAGLACASFVIRKLLEENI